MQQIQIVPWRETLWWIYYDKAGLYDYESLAAHVSVMASSISRS